MLQAKLSSTFQLSIPKAMRNALDLRAGQQFTLLARGRIIELIPQRSVMEAKGMLSGCECADSSEYRDRTERSPEAESSDSSGSRSHN
jgi:AbrB family looped-hinge helix DNA binding protein